MTQGWETRRRLPGGGRLVVEMACKRPMSPVELDCKMDSEASSMGEDAKVLDSLAEEKVYKQQRTP